MNWSDGSNRALERVACICISPLLQPKNFWTDNMSQKSHESKYRANTIHLLNHTHCTKSLPTNSKWRNGQCLRTGPSQAMLGSLVRKHACTFASASFRGPVSVFSGRFMSADATTNAPAGTEEPAKPKRISQMPPLKIRLEQERLYKEAS